MIDIPGFQVGEKIYEILEKLRFCKISVELKNVYKLFITQDPSKIFTKMLNKKIYVIQNSYAYTPNNSCNYR